MVLRNVGEDGEDGGNISPRPKCRLPLFYSRGGDRIVSAQRPLLYIVSNVIHIAEYTGAMWN